LCERLLQLNVEDMVHGAYGIADGAVVMTCALRLENLDYNELQGTLDDSTLAITNHYKTLARFRSAAWTRRRSDMGFFGRLAQLIKSNLNDLINRAEDPEKMLNQVITEMNTQLIEAKKQVAVAIADEKKLQKQFQSESGVAGEWERKAMMA